MKTVLFDDRTWAVMIAVVTILVGFFVSLVAGFVVLCVLAISYASRIAPQIRKIREKMEQQATEAAEQRQKEEAVFAQMRAERERTEAFYMRLRRGIEDWRSLHFSTGGDTTKTINLGGITKEYYLADGRLMECGVNESASWRTLVNVIEAQWEEHETYSPFPDGPHLTWSYTLAKPEGTQRHEFYLAWFGPTKWWVLSWGEQGVTLQDIFDKTITLPSTSDLIRDVLDFVTRFDSVEAYALDNIATWALPEIAHAAPRPGLHKARVALTLKAEALDGRPLTQEAWDDLIRRDPTNKL